MLVTVSRCNAVGVEVLYKISGKLAGERTRRPLSFTISDCLFADYAALICSFREVACGWCPYYN